jgi:hypothetical protein
MPAGGGEAAGVFILNVGGGSDEVDIGCDGAAGVLGGASAGCALVVEAAAGAAYVVVAAALPQQPGDPCGC